MSFNPKVSDFLEKDPEMNMLELAWSLFWRLYVVLLGICFAGGIISVLLD